MFRWNNDYNRGAHPQILQAMLETNESHNDGYGLDDWCQKARVEIKKYLNDDSVDIHFMTGGTQTNFTVISAALRAYQCVISPESGHINCYETGAIEHGGHRIHALSESNGKITADQIREEAESYASSGSQEHITQPKLVYISFPTEYGTIYSKKELQEIRAVCDEYNMNLFIDGARMGYGLAAEGCDVTLADLTALTDIFYIGGTKCGAMFGEAVIIRNNDLKDHFRSYIKQNGGMFAKGWLLGLQFYTLFKDGLYFEITKKAVSDAMRIRDAFKKKGVKPYYESPTNQQFHLLTDEQKAYFDKNHFYEDEGKADPEHSIIRFCTSWATKEEDLVELLKDIENM